MKAKLLKPLDGDPEGTIREFDQADFETLSALGAVEAVSGGDDLLLDGPTVAEFVAAGYKAANYPPQGYVARSTPEEIAAAIAADEPAGAKSAPSVENKMAPPVENKAEPASSAPGADIIASTSHRKKN